MPRLVSSQRFKRNLRLFLRQHPTLRGAVVQALELLSEDPYDRRLRTHKLSGALKHCLAAFVTYEYRVVFAIEGDTIILLALGAHDEVY